MASFSHRIFHKVGRATSRVHVSNLDLVVMMGLQPMKKGYFGAIERLALAALRGAIAADDVYVAMLEAVTWVDSIADRCQLRGNVDVQGVTFARNQTHHNWASAIYFDDAGSVWKWRQADVLPVDPRYLNEALRLCYVQQLQERPLLDVFGRLEPVISGLQS